MFPIRKLLNNVEQCAHELDMYAKLCGKYEHNQHKKNFAFFLSKNFFFSISSMKFHRAAYEAAEKIETIDQYDTSALPYAFCC